MSQTDAQILRAIATGERLQDAHATRSTLIAEIYDVLAKAGL